jgi:hypothetical protein
LINLPRKGRPERLALTFSRVVSLKSLKELVILPFSQAIKRIPKKIKVKPLTILSIIDILTQKES